MRKLATSALPLAVAIVAVFLLLQGSGGGAKGTSYTVELRNAFDLTEGGDFKIAGAPAGTITKIAVDRQHLTALVTVRMDNGSKLHADATCESRPQSLIGEYFVTCDPGKSTEDLPAGARVPLARTKSTVPQDLVNNMLRVPQRQRLTLLLNEFGVGLAGRGSDLNTAIRDGVPALRETADVLNLLARQRRQLSDATQNADAVVSALAKRRHEVTEFVKQAGDTADTTASRSAQLRAGLQRLPAFLTQLQSTMSALDQFATAQTPAARRLGQVADPLDQFLGDVVPLAKAAKPGVKSLAKTFDKGSSTAKAALPTTQQLNAATKGLPELSTNLRFILEHLDDPDAGVRHDPRAIRQLASPGPGGDRYNGLQALLQYVFDQGMDANMYNANGHFLSLDAIAAGPCTTYTNAETVRKNPAMEKQCGGNVIGPSSPGIHDPDPGFGDKVSAKTVDQRRTDLTTVVGAATSATNRPASGADQTPLIDYLLAP
jgi:virulence factor Mce-like protein